jgi:hypothetical protein
MIDAPDLEIRNEDRLAADAIARVSGGLTLGVIDAQIATRRELRPLVEAGLDEPVCPELTNANPGSPHTVMIEAFAWALAQQAHRFNQVPLQNFVAFANLFGITPRAATAAITTLRFTVDAPTGGTVVTIPAGTEVQSEDGTYVFETTVEGQRTGDGTVDIAAIRNLTGHTLLSPGVLIELVDTPAFVTAVTNPNAIDSGTEAEPIEKTLERVRLYQKRGERIVSVRDLEEAILDEAMQGNGVVRAFPFVINGDFDQKPSVGYTSVVVMTKTGDNVDAATRQRIAALTDTAVGNQFIYVVDPTFVEFDVEVEIKLKTDAPDDAVLAAVEANLRAFYAAARENFGRPILRSEIIAVIEGTTGVDRIVAGVNSILASPTVDTQLREYELPKLEEVTVTVT